MNKRGMLAKAMGYGLEIGGGALAGYVDAKFPDKGVTLGGSRLGMGTLIAAGGLAAGILGFGGRFGKMAGDVGAGAAAFEVGKMVTNQTAASSAALRSGVRGVGALPSGRRVSQRDIRQALRELAAV